MRGGRQQFGVSGGNKNGLTVGLDDGRATRQTDPRSVRFKTMKFISCEEYLGVNGTVKHSYRSVPVTSRASVVSC